MIKTMKTIRAAAKVHKSNRLRKQTERLAYPNPKVNLNPINSSRQETRRCIEIITNIKKPNWKSNPFFMCVNYASNRRKNVGAGKTNMNYNQQMMEH